ncbi:vitamin K epoxide reductase complex subunit 1-like protein 1 [Hydra vulgaris]|uniref:vitamin K epoxide reductase complex subunit 1-like protein 1 n=1 Tax=Hydra vulgaris TaxID=6087 RepID=UPI001F5FDC30|nr:vitamin K epoxide reductase complex subunit 1 [Hydra vulgaris]
MLDTNKVLRIAVSFLGVLISLYTLYVEIHALADKNYKAMCDINENVSCTKVFLSKHGKGFGLIGPILGENSALNLPNPVYGIAKGKLVSASIQLISCTSLQIPSTSTHSKVALSAQLIVFGNNCMSWSPVLLKDKLLASTIQLSD